MDNTTTNSTLAIQGITPYAMTPKWIIRAGDNLSHGAVRLYGALMSYASNEGNEAFPARATLADDIGSNSRSISRFIKELENFGAIKVTRRRNKRTGNFYANHYVLIFDTPGDKIGTRRDDEFDPITKPTSLTKPTPDFTPKNPGGVPNDEPDHCTVEQSSAEKHFTRKTSFDARDDHLPKGAYLYLRDRLQDVGKSILETGSFHDEDTQDLWGDFETLLEEATEHLPYGFAAVDLTQNGKWTVSAKVADEYMAGKELTTLLNTARQESF